VFNNPLPPFSARLAAVAATSIDLADFDPLAPEPAMLTEIRIGYAR
jgi:hypothetical protein